MKINEEATAQSLNWSFGHGSYMKPTEGKGIAVFLSGKRDEENCCKFNDKACGSNTGDK
jgi:hypothetical protein